MYLCTGTGPQHRQSYVEQLDSLQEEEGLGVQMEVLARKAAWDKPVGTVRELRSPQTGAEDVPCASTATRVPSKLPPRLPAPSLCQSKHIRDCSVHLCVPSSVPDVWQVFQTRKS